MGENKSDIAWSYGLFGGKNFHWLFPKRVWFLHFLKFFFAWPWKVLKFRSTFYKSNIYIITATIFAMLINIVGKTFTIGSRCMRVSNEHCLICWYWRDIVNACFEVPERMAKSRDRCEARKLDMAWFGNIDLFFRHVWWYADLWICRCVICVIVSHTRILNSGVCRRFLWCRYGGLKQYWGVLEYSTVESVAILLCVLCCCGTI